MSILKKIIFGNQKFESEAWRDKFLLAGYFLLMYVVVDVLFLVIYYANTINYSFVHAIKVYIGLFISAGAIFLLRKGWRDAAILIQLIRTNYIAYNFSTINSQSSETGIFLFFTVSGIGAMALYGYEERWKGIFFSLISLGLFYVSIFEPSRFEPRNSHFFLVIIFTITYIMVFVIIFFLNQLNFLSKQKESEKHKELTKVNAELDRFVYSVSHDLRAPLSSISGLIQLLERTNDKKEMTEYLNLMKGRIDRLEYFIRDIINFSRNARSEIREVKINVKEMIDEIFDTLKFINGAESIDLKNDLDDSQVVTTDPSRFQIVMFNLISNAIQYRDSYKNSFIKVTSVVVGDRLKLNLDDNGIGIDATHQTKVFNMFYRASENSKGSGLGLYIVKETMEKLGGTISLQSIRGEGTRFIIELPLQRSPGPSTSEI